MIFFHRDSGIASSAAQVARPTCRRRTDGRTDGGNAPRLRLLLTPPPRRRRLLRSLVSWSDARTNLGQCIQTTLGIWTYIYQLDVGAE